MDIAKGVKRPAADENIGQTPSHTQKRRRKSDDARSTPTQLPPDQFESIRAVLRNETLSKNERAQAMYKMISEPGFITPDIRANERLTVGSNEYGFLMDVLKIVKDGYRSESLSEKVEEKYREWFGNHEKEPQDPWKLDARVHGDLGWDTF